MSKGRYHSIECKAVDWSRLAEQVGEDRVVLAIDVAKHDFVATLQRPPRQVLGRIKWQHPQETRRLLSGVAQLQVRGRVEAVMAAKYKPGRRSVLALIKWEGEHEDSWEPLGMLTPDMQQEARAMLPQKDVAARMVAAP